MQVSEDIDKLGFHLLIKYNYSNCSPHSPSHCAKNGDLLYHLHLHSLSPVTEFHTNIMNVQSNNSLRGLSNHWWIMKFKCMVQLEVDKPNQCVVELNKSQHDAEVNISWHLETSHNSVNSNMAQGNTFSR